MNQHPEYLLNKIKSPADLKVLSLDEMKQVAGEIRHLIIEKDAAVGGHLGPDLGIVELTIAYHYVFNAPGDKIVWDVSHQTYPHKMLTGRAYAWLDPEAYGKVTPYTDPEESPYDYYAIGHTSTSIALATGMAKARDLLGGSEKIMAVIGDGSLTGGLAYEGLNNAATEKGNLVIVINDNQWSIDKNVGGLPVALKKLRDTNGEASDNLFKAMGFDYRYVADGNSLEAMIAAFQDVKDVDHPVVLHVNTLKGKGYEPALANEEAHHWVSPFNLEDDSPKHPAPALTPKKVAVQTIAEAIDRGQENLLAINAAIPGAFNLDGFKEQYPDHYLDVGIAEQESVALAAGFVKAGGRAILFENSTFLQRAFDQLSHDVALNNLPVVMLVGGGGIQANSKTHVGVFDQVMISNLPNWQYLAPTTLAEEKAMINWAIQQKAGPVAIKLPVWPVDEKGSTLEGYQHIHYQKWRAGQGAAILSLGDTFNLGLKAAEELNASLYNPLSANTLDTDCLDHLARHYSVIITLENNVLDGGFGQKVASYLADQPVLVKSFGEKREYTDVDQSLAEILNRNHLTAEQIVNDVKQLLSSKN
ncbi:Deoxyxylulose-5-phosphate synthase [Lactobacillus equicursoris DSM 19284 = JCM 14600 = CIP 110162]|uniref:1-deoxy-D-xylulose-5-phosphate synthase n=1 Tax=Lactobacillus equicursoris DSM 19284 = JCM 14600 = CIP 110162 TaxID=1293597 RepID=K0NJF3_9LACO|nr:1-deoxy-D-xylulose-5-phosphate synthase [Lactobacillus equicursoris]KRL02257.1 1-deoxy-d-xylulose-5-phosphate synthase 2 [Lactobacillus equicursoris DSM 19284 = JCM 14600 = CIP 110162]CCK85397.1 Deoxyxylulose-5-phosphate synthase [Lactobacillus equicursoris DSM 19284 = JCM 14600 = CIP 110162]